MPKLTSIDHLVLTVSSIQRTVAFYEHLGMQASNFTAQDGTKRTTLTFGSQKINLHPVSSEFLPRAAQPGPGTGDLCFLSGDPLDDWQRHLERLDIAIEEGPVMRTGATGPIMSIYIRDPDQNLIEIAVKT